MSTSEQTTTDDRLKEARNALLAELADKVRHRAIQKRLRSGAAVEAAPFYLREAEELLAEVEAFLAGAGLGPSSNLPKVVIAYRAGLDGEVPDLPEWREVGRALEGATSLEWETYKQLHHRFRGVDPNQR